VSGADVFGLAFHLGACRFIAGQLRNDTGGSRRHGVFGRRLGAHRQIVGLRIELPQRGADQTCLAAPAQKEEAVRLERRNAAGTLSRGRTSIRFT
jgi:hypothetical protein